MNSVRMFTVVFLEGDYTFSDPGVSLGQIIKVKSTKEWEFACHDNIDAILDLKVGERLQMNFNRDNPDSAGFIKRIK